MCIKASRARIRCCRITGYVALFKSEGSAVGLSITLGTGGCRKTTSERVSRRWNGVPGRYRHRVAAAQSYPNFFGCPQYTVVVAEQAICCIFLSDRVSAHEKLYLSI